MRGHHPSPGTQDRTPFPKTEWSLGDHAHGGSSSTLRSTTVSKKIQLNAHKSGLTKNDAEYSRLVQKVHEVFHAYFDAALRPVEDIFLHEMFFYDLISPHRDVFAPRAALILSLLCTLDEV